MALPKIYKTEAIVLKRINLGEADKILTLLTPGYGKIRAVAKGVRRPASRLGGHVELLAHSALLLARGQNLDIVTQGQTLDSYLLLRDDLWRTGVALCAAEMVDQFLPDHQENFPVYRLLLDTLGRLAEENVGEVALHYFEVQLLDYVGYRPELSVCVHCRAPLEPRPNFFGVADGGMLCPGCWNRQPHARPVSVNALKVLRYLQGNDYERARRLRLEADLRLEVESLLRQYVRYLLERDLKSAEFLDILRRQAES